MTIMSNKSEYNNSSAATNDEFERSLVEDFRKNPPAPTWTLARIDWLQVGDIVKLPNPPFGRVSSIRVANIATAPYGTPWEVYDIGIDAREWQEMTGGMSSVFQILRRGYEAIEWWRPA